MDDLRLAGLRSSRRWLAHLPDVLNFRAVLADRAFDPFR